MINGVKCICSCEVIVASIRPSPSSMFRESCLNVIKIGAVLPKNKKKEYRAQ